MAYQLTLLDWSLFTLPAAIPMTDIEGDSHANDPASPDYTPSAATWIGETFTFNGGAGIEILVTDEDGDFEDGYVETSGPQTLAQDVVINGTPYTAGASIQNEFSLVDSLGNEVWVLRIDGVNVGFVYPAASQPTAGESFTAEHGRDGNPADSGDGVTSGEAYSTFDSRDGVVQGTDAADSIDAAYTGDPEGDQIDDGLGGGPGGNANVVYAGGGNDSVDAGLGDDTVFGEDGADILQGGSGADYLQGGSGNDTLHGGADDDTLLGGDGDDSLHLGAGDDSLGGGAGSDRFVAATGAGSDTITGGETGTDAASDNDALDFGALTAAVTVTFTGDEAGTATSGADTVAFSEIESFSLTGHADRLDGSASHAAMAVGGGAGNDTVTGGVGNDTLHGESGADSLAGGAGNDRLVGGTGGDTLAGGAGTDTLDGGSGADSLVGGEGADVMLGGDDNDTLDGGSGNDSLSGGNGADVMLGGAGNDSLLGQAGNDSLYGADGNDTVEGGDGDDLIYFGPGDDLLSGGAGSDQFIAVDGFGHDTVSGGELGSDTDFLDFRALTTGVTVTYTADETGTVTSGAQTLAFSEIENIWLTDQADSVDGTASASYMGIGAGAGDDTVTTGSGDDIVAGEEGNDLIDGGSGGDTLAGGLGADTIYGGAGADSITGGAGDDVVYTGTGIDTVETGEGSDTIYLDDDDDAGSNHLSDSGTTGSDRIILSTGAGTYRIQGVFSAAEGFETIDGSGASGDILGTNDAVANFDFSGITLLGVDQIIGTDGNDLITGSASADSIDGGAGADLLAGGTGNDTLTGNTGNDTLRGDAGDDLLQGQDGADLLEGGDGSDTIEGGSGGDTINADGGADRISGEDGADVIFGGGGDDSANGGLGNDTLYGGQGADSLLGGDGNDALYGDDFSAAGGNDTLIGNAGDDSFNGNAGNDLLTGGAGNDYFLVSDGDDTITDFNTGNTGALGDGDIFNNDFLNLTGYYDSLKELRADQADDGVLNQSNSLENGGDVDYSDNTRFGSRSMTVQGATAESYSYDNTGVVCFTTGTRILTPRGEVPVEELQPGDLVNTLDHGPQPLLWIGQRKVSASELRGNEKLRPVQIKPGALGNRRELLVSRQHGVMLGADHLVRAIHLAGWARGVRVAQGKRAVTYVHLLFQRHEVIFAEGIASESFYPGPNALAAMTAPARADLLRHVPGLAQLRAVGDRRTVEEVYGPTARPFAAAEDLPRLPGTRRFRLAA